MNVVGTICYCSFPAFTMDRFFILYQVRTQNLSLCFGRGGGGLAADIEAIYNLCLILKVCY
jgi:hypothetical protein